MANYDVDIQLAVKNLNTIKALKKELDAVEQALEKISKLDTFDSSGFRARSQARKDENNQIKEQIRLTKDLKMAESARRAELVRAVRLERQQRMQGLQQYAGPIGPGPASPVGGRIRQMMEVEQLTKAAFDALSQMAVAAKAHDNNVTQIELANDDAVFKEKLTKIDDLAKAELAASKAANKDALDDFDRRLKNRVSRRKNSLFGDATVQQRAGAAVSAGAFPLLFGGGPGMALGGAIGGAVTGKTFGPASIALQVLGGFFDELATKAATLGQALNLATADVTAVVESLGMVGSPTQDAIQSLEELVGEQVALEAATRQLALVVGSDGVQALADFGDASTQFGNALTQLTTQLLADIARLSGPVLKNIAGGLQFEADLLAARVSEDPRQLLLRAQLQNINPIEDTLVGRQRRDIEIEMVETQRKIKQEKEEALKAQVEAAQAGSAEREIAENNLKIAQLNSDLTNKQVFDLMKRNVIIDAENKKLEEGVDTRLIDLNTQQQLTDLTNRRNALLETANKKAAEAADKANDQLIASQNLSAEFRRELKIREQTSKLSRDLARAQARYEKDLERIRRTNMGLDDQSLRISQEQQALDLLAVNTANALADAAERLTNAKMFKTPLQIFGEDSAFAADFENSIMGAIRMQEELDKVLEKYPMIEQASQAMATTVTSGFAELVSGAKSAEQVFAEFLRSIADMLISTAQQMIAQYIAIGIARMFAIPGSTYQPKFDGASLFSGQTAAFSPFGIDFGSFSKPMANGGAVGAGRPYMVGERGPELFIPGAQGNIVPNHAMGSSNIVVNVDASGSEVQGDQPNAKALGAAIGVAVQAELVKQKRPGGLLA